MTSEREVVLITGTSRGIGRTLAEHFLDRGALVEGCSREEAGWQAERYTHHLVDVTMEDQVKGMLSSVQSRLGRLDVVVNNAGTASMNHVLLTPGKTADKVMATNFGGTFLVCREAAKLMKKRGYGRIINVTTIAVPMLLAGEAVYAASKSAVVTFTQILAREVADFGITCNVVGPSVIETDLVRSIPRQKIDSLLERLAIKRPARFHDVANVVDFFASPQSDYITGQVIYLGGV